MKLTETIDLAARLMVRAGHLIEGESVIEDHSLHKFWVYSRDLANDWMLNLSVCQKVLAQGDSIRSRQCWLEYEPDLREVLRADVLHRAWYTILKAVDAKKNMTHAEPIARSVLNHQLQIRTRVLKLILSGYQIDAERMKQLNEVRRSAEAWTDLICAHLVEKYEIEGILFDHSRAKRWGIQPLENIIPDLKLPVSTTNSRQSELNWNIVSSTQLTSVLNPLQRLARTMLDCFPRSAFNHDGTLGPASR